MAVLDTSKSGLVEGFWKFLKVLGWYIGSAIVTAVVAYTARYNIVNESNGMIVGAVALVNAFGAGVTKWLATHQPSELVPDQG